MKAVFISYNQSLHEQVVAILDRNQCRGYSAWEQTTGRGSCTGEPHLGSHAWPTLNTSLLTMVPNDRVEKLVMMLRALDESAAAQGLRAFVWNIEASI